MFARSFALIPASLACLACACSSTPARTAAAPAGEDGFGLNREQAIEVCRPEGERNYLARLVCPDDSHPTFERVGNVGSRHELPANLSESAQTAIIMDNMGYKTLRPGAIDYHIVDAYAVECGETTTTLYLDMYHCDAPAPSRAPLGFTIIH